MNWPLVSRRAYDLLLDERDRLRTQNDGLVDSLTRLKRVQHGVREVPKQPKRAEPEAMPHAIRELINGFSAPGVQRELERQVWQSRGVGTPWDQIQRFLETELLEPAALPDATGHP